MANSIKEASRLTKRILLSNLGARYGEALTPMLSGQHGIGKSNVIRMIGEMLGGRTITIEASMLSEGEICGLPIASKNTDGTSEIYFAPHPAFASIMRAQKFVYEKAKGEGFLGGRLRIDENGRTIHIVKDPETGKDKQIVYDENDAFEKALGGSQNIYKFGEQLDLETKIELLESKEIRPVLVFIDELNRTDNQTMKELMNVVLNRVVNGYELPWWCMIAAAINPATQDSAYAVNQFDDAQLDRFIRIPVTSKLDDWVDHGLENHVNRELIQAVSSSENIFMAKMDNLESETPATPSPRSWSMIAGFMDTMDRINQTKFFTPEERQMLKADFREIVNCKVGATAGRTMITNLENKVNIVKPAEIINGETPEINPTILKKLAEQKSIQRKITADSVIRYLAEEYANFEAYSKKNEMKDRNKFTNFTKQLTQYMNELDSATKIVFMKTLINGVTLKDTKIMLYSKIAKYFAKDMIEFINDFQKDRGAIIKGNE